MDDALAVSVVEGIGDPDGKKEDLIHGDRPARESTRERFAVDVFHRKIVHAALRANVV